ncbi:hypothetical protein [uncultured Gimesia sp.]|uniref:hypothetical protein n=1 Tax=uncultured Gimesia sp. TaxID=1678688 RepID=UPI0030D79D39|tara:strand:- start:168775 stop:170241 length:1467 start_codon:yes stop_codon:yes gene_type:complete
MSLATACGVTVLRSLCISILGVLLSRHLSRLVETGYSRRSVFLLILILAPLLVPELIVGYAWWLISLKLVHYPFLIELIYSGLVLLKVVPVGMICFCLSAPSAISPEADFIRKSVKSPSAQIIKARAQWSFFLWKTVIRLFPVAALLFLLAFQEFEMASLLYRDSWTVWIFDAQAGGVPVTKTLAFLTGPFLVELILIAGVVMVLSRLQNRPALNQPYQTKNVTRVSAFLSWGYLLAAFCIIGLVPFLFIGWGSMLALGSLLQNQLQLKGTIQECVWGLFYGTTSGIAAWGLASFFFASKQAHRFKVAGFICCLPGLCGALTLALLIASAFLSHYIYWLYDTPLAIFVALVLFLFPRAVFLKLILQTHSKNDASYLARLLSQSKNKVQALKGDRLRWAVNGRMQYWAVVILAFWAYWNVTLSSILAPSQAQPSAVRLYNLMHYGQNSVLSAITLLSLGIPVCVSLLLLPVVKKLWILSSNRSGLTETE